LMTNRRGIKGQFISSSTTGYTDLFRQWCYDAWGMVEDNCPALGKRKQSCW
jgi:hypothetical protein